MLLAFGYSRSSHGVTVTPGTDEEPREGRSPDMPMMARGCTLMARGLAAAADDGGCCCSTSIPESKCFGRALAARAGWVDQIVLSSCWT